MKKSIYLYGENYSKIKFEYENILDLKEELDKRKISIGDHASIGYGASIGDYASIGDHVSIGYRASIGDHASIGYGASIGDRASIGYRASIGDHVKLQKNFYIVSSKHCITYTGNDTLSIGCHNYTIDKWLEKFEIIGKKANYSETEINEYKQYILMAKEFSKI